VFASHGIVDVSSFVRHTFWPAMRWQDGNDYYEILGVASNATQEEIKQAWKFYVQAFHPDKFAERQRQAAEERIKAINDAYDVLSDPTKRASYDQERTRQTRAESTGTSHSSAPPESPPDSATGRPSSPPPDQPTPAGDSPTHSNAAIFEDRMLILFLWAGAAIMLVSAAVGRHPYSFYMLLRWICCPIFAYSALTVHAKNRFLWSWIFGALAVLYNPIFRVHLDRITWIGVNWFTVGVIIVAAVAFLPRRAQIWIAATGLVFITALGLWQLQPVTGLRKSVSSASRELSVSKPVMTATPEIDYNPPIPGETTWQWLQRIDLHGLPGNNNIELEPSEPLATSHPFAKPKPGDPLYDARKERELKSATPKTL
jgi:hypothetical protein